MNSVDITSYVSKIVVGYLRGNHPFPQGRLSRLIETVNIGLTHVLTEPLAPLLRRPIPAIEPNRSVTNSEVICLFCLFRGQMLKRHIKLRHGLTPSEYRSFWGLAPDHPLVSPERSGQP